MTKTNTGIKFDFGALSLNLKLDGKAIVQIEKRLKKSIMSMFMSGNGNVQLPPTNEVLIFLQGANQTSGVTDKKLVDNFQKYLDDGHTTMDLFGILTDVVDQAGFFGKKSSDKKTEEPLTLDNEETEEEEIL